MNTTDLLTLCDEVERKVGDPHSTYALDSLQVAAFRLAALAREAALEVEAMTAAVRRGFDEQRALLSVYAQRDNARFERDSLKARAEKAEQENAQLRAEKSTDNHYWNLVARFAAKVLPGQGLSPGDIADGIAALKARAETAEADAKKYVAAFYGQSDPVPLMQLAVAEDALERYGIAVEKPIRQAVFDVEHDEAEVERLRTELDAANRAGAAMRAALESTVAALDIAVIGGRSRTCPECMESGKHRQPCSISWAYYATRAALSTDCGKGWLSPEEAAKLHEELLHWHSLAAVICADGGQYYTEHGAEATAKRCAEELQRLHTELADYKRAEEIQVRRGWFAVKTPFGWVACKDWTQDSVTTVLPSVLECRGHPDWIKHHPTPTAAILAAEEWYLENAKEPS